MAEQQAGLWADLEAALRPGPEEYYRRLVAELEAERDPEQLALRWLRRLLQLLSSDEVALFAAINEAVQELDERCGYLTGLIEWARHELQAMGSEPPPQPDVQAIEPDSESGWQAWLAQSPVGYQRGPLSDVARDREGFPVGKLHHLAATAE